MTSTYLDRVHQLIESVSSANAKSLPMVSDLIATSISDGGVVHVFGSGHSSLMAQEIFYRAGGFAPVNAMLDVNLTIFGTSRPTWVERLEGYAPSILASYDVTPGEVLLIISNSGINAVPIDLALAAKDRGLTTIAVGSVENYRHADSRHSSGQSLFAVTDYALDTCVPPGDAIHQVTDDTAVGAVSTVLGATLLNLLMNAVADILAERGQSLPVFTSQNVPGGDDRNAGLVERYRHRIPLMKP